MISLNSRYIWNGKHQNVEVYTTFPVGQATSGSLSAPHLPHPANYLDKQEAGVPRPTEELFRGGEAETEGGTGPGEQKYRLQHPLTRRQFV